MSTPLPGDLHVNAPLGNFSVMYTQSASNFVADLIFPNIPVSKQSDLFYTYDRGDFNRNDMQKRAPGTESAGGGYSMGEDQYFCHVYAFHHDIPDERRANADSMLSTDKTATHLVTKKALLFREAKWATDFFTTGKWGTDIVGHATTDTGANRIMWSDYTTGDPISDIRRAVDHVLATTGYIMNTMVMGRTVMTTLLDHPDIIDRLDNGQTPGGPAQASLGDLQNLFNMERVFVMNAIHNTANMNSADAHSFIADPESCLLCYSENSPALETASAGYTFSWNGLLGSSAMGSRIRKFRMELINSDRIEIDMAYTTKIVGSDLGVFFSNIVDPITWA